VAVNRLYAMKALFNPLVVRRVRLASEEDTLSASDETQRE
jgi:hypothetical protein